MCQFKAHKVSANIQNLQTSCNIGKSPYMQAFGWLWLLSTILLVELFPSVLYIKRSGESSSSADSDLGHSPPEQAGIYVSAEQADMQKKPEIMLK